METRANRKDGDLEETSDEDCQLKRLRFSENLIPDESKIEENEEIVSETNFTSLPPEMLFEILSYLPSYRDLSSLKRVNTFFERLTSDPTKWTVFEVRRNNMHTEDVIEGLKQMPFLKKFSIDGRSDSDAILRQLSLTNKNVEELFISNCTGSELKLYLRSTYLVRILERLTRLHTICILGSYFRGLKFMKLLANMGSRLKTASIQTTYTQYRAYARYFSKHSTLIDYLYSTFLTLDINRCSGRCQQISDKN